MTPEKRCSRCREAWPADTAFFRPRSSATHRLLCWCRACEAEQKANARNANRNKNSDG